MLPAFLFLFTLVLTQIHLILKKPADFDEVVEVFLSYLIFFNIGVMGLLGFYGHAFLSEEMALDIGWEPNGPFQYQVAMANLAFGLLGLLSLWFRGLFWAATVIGSSIFLLGCLIGHLIQYKWGNMTPYNIGPIIWIGDLVIPLLCLSLLGYLVYQKKIPLG
jgi:hypothetical protein